MVRNRRGLAPWSLSREAGIESATVDGTIDVPQSVQPTIDTGFVDEKGDWKGVKSSDKDFIAISTEFGIANGATILAPSVNPDGTWPLDMTGFNSIFIAINPSNGGNYAIEAVMGPDSVSFANLTPVDAATLLQGNLYSKQESQNLFRDTSHGLTVDVWNLIYLQDTLQNQKLLQFQITNNSGGSSDIQTAFMRLV